MGGAGVDRSRILGRRGPLSPAARAGPERLGALDPSRESPHGCLGECRAANASRSPALEDEKTALEKTVSGLTWPLCYRGLNGCWVHSLCFWFPTLLSPNPGQLKTLRFSKDSFKERICEIENITGIIRTKSALVCTVITVIFDACR